MTLDAEPAIGTEGSVERALAAARAHTDFVVGFICQENVLAAKNADESPSFLYCTPGVRIGTVHAAHCALTPRALHALTLHPS
jgi:hypothetical protein